MGAKRSRRDAEEALAGDLTPDRGTPLVRSAEEHNGKQRSNLLALHRARFVEWEPTAAVASGASGDGTVLAVARESGDVELWNADHWSCIAVRCSPCFVRQATRLPFFLPASYTKVQQYTTRCSVSMFRGWPARVNWRSPALPGHKSKQQEHGACSQQVWTGGSQNGTSWAGGPNNGQTQWVVLSGEWRCGHLKEQVTH